MKVRNGRFGDFYFCPKQYSGCKQPTITKNPKRSEASLILRSLNYTPVYQEYRTPTPPQRIRSCACGQNLFGIGIDYCKACGHCAS